LANQGNLGIITGPTYFVLNNKVEEMLKGIIITMQVPKLLNPIIGGFHPTPSMTIILTIHALHLSNDTPLKFLIDTTTSPKVKYRKKIKKGGILLNL
jgi:hypothetical protein